MIIPFNPDERQADRLIILGAAPCLAADLEAAGGVADAHVMAVNAAGWLYLDRVDYWTSYHPDFFTRREHWHEKRRKAGGNMDLVTIAHSSGPGVDYLVKNLTVKSGSSSLLAVLAGLELGYRDITLAGAPMDDEKYHRYRPGWVEASVRLFGRVRSMSGWTREFLEKLNALGA